MYPQHISRYSTDREYRNYHLL